MLISASMACVKMHKRLIYKNLFLLNRTKFCIRSASSEPAEDEFRVLELYPTKNIQVKRRSRFQDDQIMPPREKRMPITIDWPSVWPTAKSFRPSSVPLPINQGYDAKRAPPGKYANAELIKIPNFLHLTPPAIKRHCAVLKQFCSKWPTALTTDTECQKHFQMEITTTDYCHASPIIRDERARVVTLKTKLSYLNLDYHGRDKIIRLLGFRYRKSVDTITLVADRCPHRKQNYDYIMYLLTALHHESCVTEPWEHEKTEADMEKFFFEGSRIKDKIIKTITEIKSGSSDKPTEGGDESEGFNLSKDVELFGKAVSAVINENENPSTIKTYKEAVLESLNLNTS